MNYRLSLNKTKMHQVLTSDPRFVDVRMRDCDFFKSGRSYWMYFYSGYDYYKMYVSVCAGSVLCAFTNLTQDDGYDCCSLALQWLLDRQMLLEVA